jgi:hypothetical protein
MHRGQTSKHLCKHISSKKNAINPSAPELNARLEVPKHQNFNSSNLVSDYSWRSTFWASQCMMGYLTSGAKGLIVQVQCVKN